MRNLVLVLLIVVFGLGCASAHERDPALVAAAEKEGSLTLYGCDPPQTPLYVARFKQLYPKIQVSTYVAGCWQIYNRHVTERQAKRPAADAFFATEDVMTRMDAEHLFAAYRTPELAHFAPAAAPTGKDYLIVKTLIYGMASNRDYTKDMPLPKDWLDFANPPAAWQDRVSYYDPRTSSAAFSLLAALHQNFGEAKTAAIYKGLTKIHAGLAATTPAGLSKLLSGEQPIMFYVMNNHYNGVVAKGAPVDFHVAASGTPTLNFGIATTQGAAHPNAAKLFVDFMMSDAQQMIEKNNEYSLRAGMKAPHGMPAIDTVKLMSYDIARALADQQKLIAWWQQVTGVK